MGRALLLQSIQTRARRLLDLFAPSSGDLLETAHERSHLARGLPCVYSFSPRPTSRRSEFTDCRLPFRALASFSADSKRSAFFGERNRCSVSRMLDNSSAAISATSPPLRLEITTISRLSVTWSQSFAKFARARV